MERIKCAAVRTAEGHIIVGKYHGICYPIIGKAGFTKLESKFGDGFLTSKLRFVMRREALTIAQNAEQIIKKHTPEDILMSEDIGCPEP